MSTTSSDLLCASPSLSFHIIISINRSETQLPLGKQNRWHGNAWDTSLCLCTTQDWPTILFLASAEIRQLAFCLAYNHQNVHPFLMPTRFKPSLHKVLAISEQCRI